MLIYCGSNPLDEFSLYFYNYMMFIKWNISFSTFFLHLFILNFFFFIFLFPTKNYLIPSIFQFLKEKFFYLFVDFFKQKNISFRSFKYFILYFNLFFFILFSNLSALSHYGQSITAQLFLTLFLALSGFLGLIFIGLLLYKLFFYKIIEPENVPESLYVFIFVIEFFSFIIRPFSLAIRLFANMLAGHMLLVLITIFILFVFKYWIFFSSILIGSILLFLIILETIICFIQSYVFLILFLIYIEQIYFLWAN